MSGPMSGRDMCDWEARFWAALDSATETADLLKLAQDMKGEEIADVVYDLATIQVGCRTDYIEDIASTFARWAAEEDFNYFVDCYEVRTGKSADDAGSPYWDHKAWVDQRAAEITITYEKQETT